MNNELTQFTIFFSKLGGSSSLYIDFPKSETSIFSSGLPARRKPDSHLSTLKPVQNLKRFFSIHLATLSLLPILLFRLNKLNK